MRPTRRGRCAAAPSAPTGPWSRGCRPQVSSACGGSTGCASTSRRLQLLHTELQAAEDNAEITAARLAELQDAAPRLDEERRTRQQAVNHEAARHADLSARREALKALQEKLKTSDKLQPWLARHGLDGLQGLWSRIHIQSGWEHALESALRERIAALEVGRLDSVRGFLGGGAGDAPPAKLAFFSAPAAALPEAQGSLPRLADLLRLHDAGLRAVLCDWLQGCYTAPTLDEALSLRSQLQAGEAFQRRLADRAAA